MTRGKNVFHLHDAFGRAVRSVGENAHGDPFAVGGSVPDGLHMIAGGLGRAHGRAELAGGDDGSSALKKNQ